MIADTANSYSKNYQRAVSAEKAGIKSARPVGQMMDRDRTIRLLEVNIMDLQKRNEERDKETNTREKQIAQQFERYEQRLEEMANLHRLSQDVFDRHFEDQAGVLEELQQRLSSLDSSLAQFHKSQQVLQKDAAGWNARMHAVERELETLSSSTSSLNKENSRLQEKVGRNTETLAKFTEHTREKMSHLEETMMKRFTAVDKTNAERDRNITENRRQLSHICEVEEGSILEKKFSMLQAQIDNIRDDREQEDDFRRNLRQELMKGVHHAEDHTRHLNQEILAFKERERKIYEKLEEMAKVTENQILAVQHRLDEGNNSHIIKALERRLTSRIEQNYESLRQMAQDKGDRSLAQKVDLLMNTSNQQWIRSQNDLETIRKTINKVVTEFSKQIQSLSNVI
ncbi:viral A-type inclusion protein [Planoprotostelium fungivorum]|uniref:Viral A-type inclusion protein n=1 Tax=Planoprotostelium fungivorum TaxID=1890364 RepID=A0A2P6NIU6_9EUKA|nr:viral A-type inclusion protein [Planoprotostelium fungivorum]